MPDTRRTPSWLLKTPLAHRGLHQGTAIPENSRAAFERAIAAGYGIELDLRLTRDGEVVVFHDRELSRCCGVDARVLELSLDQLRNLRLFGSGECIPTLEECLALVRGRVPLLIELKRDAGMPFYEDRVLGILAQYDGPFAVQSFNPRTIRWFRTAAPDIPAGLLAGRAETPELSRAKRIALRFLLSIPYAKPAFISYELEGMPERFLRWVRGVTGLPFLFWTIQTEEALTRARAFDANVIFEEIAPMDNARSRR
ncbi:MAG: glycerophosphodiester phosphodiesterase [Oligoflexia bacterium]|nr:glycerophosphodiester phosphodiesterase [Oligoflexia bacterium]